MTKKYERQCWYCKSRDMEDMGDHIKCRSCGATWNEVPSLGMSPVTEVDAETGKVPQPGRDTRSRPSGRLTRSAAIARSKK